MNDTQRNADLPEPTPGAPAAAPESKPSNWNVPNALTVFRIVLVPVFLFLLLRHGNAEPAWHVWAFVVFVLAMFTDKLDGDIARKYGLITDFGKIADPIADKGLMSAALIGLAILGILPWWVPVVILVREFGITVMRFVIIRWVVLPASKGGKFKTVLQTVSLGLFLLWLPLGTVLAPAAFTAYLVVAWVLLTATILVTVVTGVDYVIQAAKLVRAARAERA